MTRLFAFLAGLIIGTMGFGLFFVFYMAIIGGFAAAVGGRGSALLMQLFTVALYLCPIAFAIWKALRIRKRTQDVDLAWNCLGFVTVMISGTTYIGFMIIDASRNGLM